MSPLERRYRRLLRLLPADHRAARGEELLGMLLDLDDGRRRPSVRQAAGVFALALRLRFVHIGSLLLAALLITASTGFIAEAVGVATGSISIETSDPARTVAVLALTILLRLTSAVAWVLGARAVALISYACVAAGPLIAFGHAGILAGDLVVFALVAVAVWRRWPAPQPRFVLLAAFPVALALWVLTAAWSQRGMDFPQIDPRVTWSLAAVGLLAGWLLAHRTGLLARIAAALAGALTPVLTPGLVYGKHTWLLSITVAVLLLGAAGGGLRRRSTAVPLPDRRSARGTTV